MFESASGMFESGFFLSDVFPYAFAIFSPLTGHLRAFCVFWSVLVIKFQAFFFETSLQKILQNP
jgi:hypothetical protein